MLQWTIVVAFVDLECLIVRVRGYQVKQSLGPVFLKPLDLKMFSNIVYLLMGKKRYQMGHAEGIREGDSPVPLERKRVG